MAWPSAKRARNPRPAEAVETLRLQGLQALLASQMPDLIILDVTMPGQDGYQIFNGLRSNPQTQQIPVVIMTAHAENIYERISVDLGAAEHLTKPFHPLELVDRIKVLLQVAP